MTGRQVPCGRCAGTGRRMCYACRGTGGTLKEKDGGMVWQTCADCAGSGKVMCDRCTGRGTVTVGGS
jgi:DnaJ-class molecular chaperone